MSAINADPSKPDTLRASLKRKLPLATALLLAVAAAWPVVSHAGFLNSRGGGDSPFLLQRTHQLATALADGHFPVRWMPDANYGYGYPFFNFYAPLSIYISAFFHFLGFGFVRAIQMAQLAGFLVAGWAMYALARRWFQSSWAALLASAAYTLAPFHMVNVYVRGDSLAEFWAMALYPLLLLSADFLVRPSWSPDSGEQHETFTLKTRVAFFSLAYAALILSHNISALIFTPFLLLYLVIAAADRRAGNVLRREAGNSTGATTSLLIPLVVGVLIGLVLSAWFWLPALGERGMAQLDAVTSGYFHFSNHFRGLDLVQTSLLFDYDVAEGEAFRMGLVQTGAIIAGIGAMFLVRRRSQYSPHSQGKDGVFLKKPRLFILLGLLLSTLMITPFSRPLWERLPLLSFTQFPWRFLSIQALFGALTVASLGRIPFRRLAVPALLALIVVAGVADLAPDRLAISESDVTGDRLAEYEWFTGNIGTTVSAEYLPPEVGSRPFTSAWLKSGDRDRVQELNSVVARKELIHRGATDQQWIMDTQAPTATITLPTLYWPGWEATLNGEPAPIWPAPGSGLITIELASGEQWLDLRLARTPIRLAAELVSLAGLAVIGWQMWPVLRRQPWRHWILLALAISVTATTLRLIPGRVVEDRAESWDFVQTAYLHSAVEGIAFEGGAWLQDYDYSRETVTGGEPFTIDLYWDPVPAGEVTVNLTTPAIQRTQLAPVIMGRRQAGDRIGDPMTFLFELPSNTPAGLYVPQIRVNGGQALTPSGKTRGSPYLQPIRVNELVQTGGRNAPLLGVRALDALLQGEDTLSIQLQWHTKKALTLNYNFSLRLTDSRGKDLRQVDGQTGYGFQPSSLWTPGLYVDDWLGVKLPEAVFNDQAAGPYGLVIRLYNPVTGQEVLIRRLGELAMKEGLLTFRETERLFTLPAGIRPSSIVFDQRIRLSGFTMESGDETLDLVLYWEALRHEHEDFYHFVHLIDPTSGEIVAQHDSMPNNNSYPTSQWITGEIVADAVRLDLAALSPGEYRVQAGLYRRDGDQEVRLAAVDEFDRRLAGDSFGLDPGIAVDR